MDHAQADRLAARRHLQIRGWIPLRSEHFRHLRPPELAVWMGTNSECGTDAQACEAPTLSGAGWLLQPVGTSPASGVEARWLDALDPSQRKDLFSGLPSSTNDDAAPFAWAHLALCREGLRLRLRTPPGKTPQDHEVIWLHLRHQPRQTVEAPMLVVELEAGVRCVLFETHERDPDACDHRLTQNLHTHLHLAAGAELKHLRLAMPRPHDIVAQHVHATLDQGASYTQTLVATGSAYHLQRTTLQLNGSSAKARTATVLLPTGQAVEQQVHSRLEAASTAAHTEVLALASGHERAIANAHSHIAPGARDAQVRQRLAGVAMEGHPHIVLRPHLEIMHDHVQAAHGATWGHLSEDALFYARQRGLDDTQARALITEGMAHAVLEQALGACRTWSAESENGTQREQFLQDSQAHSPAMGQEDCEKWTAAAHLQPANSKSDRLLDDKTGQQALEHWLASGVLSGALAHQLLQSHQESRDEL